MENRPSRSEVSNPTVPTLVRSFTTPGDAGNVQVVGALAYVADGIRGLQIVDARSPGRFRGEEAEPRAGVEPGHMPGAKNVSDGPSTKIWWWRWSRTSEKRNPGSARGNCK